jgi:hypothetical protein
VSFGDGPKRNVARNPAQPFKWKGGCKNDCVKTTSPVTMPHHHRFKWRGVLGRLLCSILLMRLAWWGVSNGNDAPRATNISISVAVSYGSRDLSHEGIGNWRHVFIYIAAGFAALVKPPSRRSILQSVANHRNRTNATARFTCQFSASYWRGDANSESRDGRTSP